MTAGTCRSIGGSMNVNLTADTYTAGLWIDCHLDLCTNGSIHAASMGSCKQRKGSGIFQMMGADCNASDDMSRDHSDKQWTECHLDFCDDGMYFLAKPGTCGQNMGQTKGLTYLNMT